MEVLEEPRLARHRITVDGYDRLAEAGVLDPEPRAELIEGAVIDRAPMDTTHRFVVMHLSRLLERAVGDAAHVSTQLPLRLGNSSQPEPDLALLKPRQGGYIDTMPTGLDTLLVIEVADTTLAYDVRIKAPLYARHGVPDYWVIDLAGGLLRCFAGPQADGWTAVTALERPGRVALPGLGGIEIDLSGVF